MELEQIHAGKSQSQSLNYWLVSNIFPLKRKLFAKLFSVTKVTDGNFNQIGSSWVKNDGLLSKSERSRLEMGCTLKRLTRTARKIS